MGILGPVQALAAELRGAQGSAGALGRELAARDGHAAGQAAELAAMREAHSKAQAQLNQTALDVQVTTALLKMGTIDAQVQPCMRLDMSQSWQCSEVACIAVL